MNLSVVFLQALILFVWVALLGVLMGWLFRRFIALFQRSAATPSPSVAKSTRRTERVGAPAEALKHAPAPDRPPSAVKSQEAERGVVEGKPSQAISKSHRSATESELAGMARSASALAMAGAGEPPTAPQPLAQPDERWSLRIAPRPPSEPVQDWPSREASDEVPSSSDWRAERARHGDYAPSSEGGPLFRPLDPAIAKAVLGSLSAEDPSMHDERAAPAPVDETDNQDRFDGGADPSAEPLPDEAPTQRRALDVAALSTALWQARSAAKGSEGSLFPPSRTDERMRLTIRPRAVEPAPMRDIYAAERDGTDASRGAEGWRPSKKNETGDRQADLRPFRPVGDIDALVRTRWGLPLEPDEKMDESVTENSSNDPIIEMAPDIPKGRLWGPAVALPLPSAVAAEALSGGSGPSSASDAIANFDSEEMAGSEADETAFAIGMADEEREDSLAHSAGRLASEAEAADGNAPIPEMQESEMRQVAADDRVLEDETEPFAEMEVPSTPGPADEDDEIGEAAFEPILREDRGTGPMPAETDPLPEVSPQTDMPQPLDMIDEPLPDDPPAGTEHAHGNDDLSRIKGVGPATEQRLHELGVTSYAQIAAWGPDEAAWFGEQLFFPGRVERENWIELARELIESRDGSD